MVPNEPMTTHQLNEKLTGILVFLRTTLSQQLNKEHTKSMSNFMVGVSSLVGLHDSKGKYEAVLKSLDNSVIIKPQAKVKV